jgi:hypothetical protein
VNEETQMGNGTGYLLVYKPDAVCEGVYQVRSVRHTGAKIAIKQANSGRRDNFKQKVLLVVFFP